MSTSRPRGFKYLWHKAFMASDLPVTAKAVGAVIWDYANQTGENSHPGAQVIADALRVSKKTADRQLALLRESGWFVRTSTSNAHPSRNWADVYALELPLDRGTWVSTGLAAEVAQIDPAEGQTEGHLDPTEGHLDPTEGHPCPTNRSFTSDSSHQSEPDGSGPPPPRPDDQVAIIDALANEIGLGLDEESTVIGMLNSGSHPRAARNTILARRNPPPAQHDTEAYNRARDALIPIQTTPRYDKLRAQAEAILPAGSSSMQITIRMHQLLAGEPVIKHTTNVQEQAS